MSVLGIIPTRFGSSRLPGKPLLTAGGKSLIQHVFERASKSTLLDKLVVATDDERILEEVQRFGGISIISSSKHRNGTERCAEIAAKFDYDWIVNIQGDQPLLEASQIDDLIMGMTNISAIVTLAILIDDRKLLEDPSVVKVTFSNNGIARNFSRKADYSLQKQFKHIGIYGFHREVLEKIAVLPTSERELSEKLEQLRWMAHGYEVLVKQVEHDHLSVDTIDDLVKLKELL